LVNCADCQVANNRADRNGSDGFDITFETTRARIAGNTARGNRLAGISLGSGDDNLFQGNTTTGNGAGGIEVNAAATGNRLEGNRATGNTPVDLIDETIPTCLNTWRGNSFVTDNEGDGPGAGCIR
jgi:parallel beta-helix repeat protein